MAVLDPGPLREDVRPAAETIERDITQFVQCLFRCFRTTELIQTESEFLVVGDGALIGRGPTQYDAWRSAAVNLEV